MKNLVLALILLTVARPAHAAVFQVLNTNDSGSGSLRQLIATSPSGSVIDFAPSLSGQTIRLTSGELHLSNSVSITAAGLSAGLVISGNNSSRILTVTNTSASISLSNLTLVQGNGVSAITASISGQGSAILNQGLMTLVGCTIASNFGSFGAIRQQGGGTMMMTNCTLSGNSSTGEGGAYFGAISTAVTMVHCTISSNNAAARGGGIRLASGTATVNNSIVAGNAVAGTLIHLEANLAGNLSGTNNLVTAIPNLAVLGNYGGPTPTMPPLPGSAAIDTGNNAFLTSVTTDQRGSNRLFGANVDIGSVELSFVTPMVVTLPATGVSNSVATLNGTVNTSCITWFEWGLSPFTNTTTTTRVAVAGGVVNNLVSGLTPGLIYHCRIVASNALGVARGNDILFGSPAVVINTSATLTNECHAAFTDPFTNPVTATGAPLAIAGGGQHSLALRSDRTVVGWGNSGSGRTTIPVGSSNVVAIAAGWTHSLAAKSDGTVVAWGANGDLQTTVPAGLSNVVSVAAGYNHSVALKSDGTVSVWGDGNHPVTLGFPAGLTNVVAIAAGQWGSMALRSNGTVAVWGYNGNAQLTIPAGASNAVAIAQGNFHDLALRSDGTVIGWGQNSAGQTTIPAAASNVVAIAAGGSHSLALRNDGTVVAWGNNSFSQTNVPVTLSNVVAIAGGDLFSLALKDDGTIVGWGRDFEGQTTAPANLKTLTLAVTTGGTFNTNNSPGSYLLSYIVTNSLGGAGIVSRTVVVRDTIAPVLAILGSNPFTNALNVPFVDPGATAVDLCGGSSPVSTNSTVNTSVPGNYTVTYTSVDNSSNSANVVRAVVVSPGAPSVTTLAVSSLNNTTAILSFTVNANGAPTTLWFERWSGSNTNATTPENVGSGVVAYTANTLLSGLTPGVIYRCRAVASNSMGVVYGNDLPFGFPALTLLGAATMTNECHAAFSDPGATVTAEPLIIAAGGQHGLAVKSGSKIIAWGSNVNGQTNVPAGLNNVIAVAAGDAHSLAVKGDGTVVGWGLNTTGQISIPGGLNNVVAVDAEGANSLALKSDGRVVHWGANMSGALDVPSTLSNVVGIATGFIHNTALKSDGTVTCWGYGVFGQTAIPPGLNSVKAISAGGAYNMALRSNGTVVAWGDNGNGQTNVPVSLSSVVAISSGYRHSLALKSDGTVVAWGDNGSGQTNIPSGLSNVVAISAGYEFNLALKSDGTIVGWGRTNEGQTTIPASLSKLTVSVAGSVNTNAPATYILNYTVTNSLGGITTASRTVVVQDTIAPVLTMLGSSPMTNTYDVPFIDPGATALDVCGGSIAVVTNNPVNVSVPGTYTVTYTAMDSSGNSVTTNRTVIVPPPPTTWIVTTTNDSGAGSLRQVVAGSIDGDIVRFTNTLSGSTIVLTSGEITLDKTITIDGSTLPGGIQLNGNASSRIFNVIAGSVQLTALTITNGRNSIGAGIMNAATLTMDRCTVAGNVSTSGGGGVASSGLVARLYLQNCTVAGNRASFAGGILSRGSNSIVTLVHTTIATNVTTGGTGGLVVETGSLAILENTIIAGNQHLGNPSGADVGGTGGTLNLLGNNIIGVSGSYGSVTPAGAPNINGDYVGTAASPLNPRLAPPGNYGGPTQTMQPLPGSPALDFCTNGTSLLIDQRGFIRVVGLFADIGAVEGAFSPTIWLTHLTESNEMLVSFLFPSTNYGVSFSVLASTNITVPMNSWLNLGTAIEVPPGSGQFQFTDSQVTNNLQRFYRVKTP